MTLPAINLEVLRTVPLAQKIGLLVLTLAGIVVGFYYYIVEPKTTEIAGLQSEISKLDGDIQTLSIKVKHLDELIAASKQLEIELAKKKERLPPEEEAVMLLKQVSDLAIRLGLDVKLWRPSVKSEDPSKLFVRMPVNVEVAGGYHTAALFFDRINSLPRIVTVSGVKMGSPKSDKGRVVTQTVFDLIAYAAPQESKTVAAVPATQGK
ncbi:putative Type IV pilus biogenesis protein PilO [Nitrospira japonica]|uniref:Putative Type IV pilus biogenesis protein PilO n=1 Tax=Nitrospira japonica TaxID=1325564 RepID=A0A1W1I6B3_9BACT|nr:type 4a pilus biogenesis protein PilO [Nitrospira japonica]SLM48547.1 putative Type IV pilus biogenesis protein PilO [Nitrospira japonica]